MKYIPLLILIAFIVMLISTLLLQGVIGNILAIIALISIFSAFLFFMFSATGIALGFICIALYNIFKSTKVNALT